MVAVRKVAFHLFVLFFAGSVVAVAARDMRAKLKESEGSDHTQVQALIKQLKGDPLANKAEKEDESEEERQAKFLQPSVLPARAPGRFLTERDRQIFRSIVRRFIAVSEEAAS